MNSAKRKQQAPLTYDDELTLPQAFLFYFPEDATYTTLGLQHRSWPPTMSLMDKVRLRSRDAVNLRLETGQRVEAYLLSFGTVNDMKEKERLLNEQLHRRGPLDLDASFDFLDSLSQDLSQEDLLEASIGAAAAAASGSIDHSGSQVPVTNDQSATQEKLIAAILKLDLSVNNLTKAVQACTKSFGKRRSEETAGVLPAAVAAPTNPIMSCSMYNGVDLTKLSGRRPAKYATSLAKVLFNEEELKANMISPQKGKSSRPALDEHRQKLLKDALMSRFPSHEAWDEARAAVNQLGLDLKKSAKKTT